MLYVTRLLIIIEYYIKELIVLFIYCVEKKR